VQNLWITFIFIVSFLIDMSHIINKLLGRDDESESHSQSHSSHGKTETHTSTSAGGSERHSQRQNGGGAQIIEGRTVQHEGVNIKSTISSDASSTVSMVNQQKLNDLVSKLGLLSLLLTHFSPFIFSSRFDSYPNR
jgi:hypothetical protein